jgi:hypothetical protein
MSHAATFFWRDARQNDAEFRERNLRAKLKQTRPAPYRVVQIKATFGRFGDSFSRSRRVPQFFGVLEWMMDVSSTFFDGENIDVMRSFQRGAEDVRHHCVQMYPFWHTPENNHSQPFLNHIYSRNWRHTKSIWAVGDRTHHKRFIEDKQAVKCRLVYPSTTYY